MIISALYLCIAKKIVYYKFPCFEGPYWEKVYFRSQILERPSIGKYWNISGVPVLPENVIFTFFRMCWCYSEAYSTGTQKWSSIVQYSCTSIWDLKYTFSPYCSEHIWCGLKYRKFYGKIWGSNNVFYFFVQKLTFLPQISYETSCILKIYLGIHLPCTFSFIKILWFIEIWQKCYELHSFDCEMVQIYQYMNM